MVSSLYRRDWAAQTDTNTPRQQYLDSVRQAIGNGGAFTNSRHFWRLQPKRIVRVCSGIGVALSALVDCSHIRLPPEETRSSHTRLGASMLLECVRLDLIVDQVVIDTSSVDASAA